MRVNKTLTGTAGTPVNVLTGLTTAPASGEPPVYAKRIFIQMLAAASGGMGYVLTASQGRVPSAANSSDLAAQLTAAPSASSPGGNYSDTDPFAYIDLGTIWIDWQTTGNPTLVSYDLKV